MLKGVNFVMKKYFILLLAFCMLFVCACAETEKDTSADTDKTATPSTQAVGTGKADESTGEADSSATDKSEQTSKKDEISTPVSKPADPSTSKVDMPESKPVESATSKVDTPESKPTDQPKPPVTDPPKTEDKVELPSSYNLQFDNNKNGIYNYCPSIMQIDENTRYIYYCTNRVSYNVTDFIGCRKGTKGADGKWSWSAEMIVLEPTPNTWDARHVCDPSVIAGEFKYNGESYSYLMAYLGCTSDNSQENKLGLAVAKSPEGPFVKVGNAPLVDFVRDTSKDEIFQWGVGQASLINMDKKADIMLFYTRGDATATRTIVERWDLSDLSKPVCKSSEKLSEAGLTNLKGGADIINNADFVYDSKAGRFYATSDCHPNPTSVPDFISSHFRVTYFDKPSNYKTFTWKYLSQIGPEQTTFERNHNTGILRDEYGHLANNYITVYYTVSDTGNNSLWSYRIYDYHVELAK